MFNLYRTSDSGENYKYIATVNVTNDVDSMYIDYTVPAGSVSTFFGTQ